MPDRAAATFLVFVSVLLSAALPACSHPPPLAVRPAAAGEPQVRIVTFNVNYGRAGDPETLAAIGRQEADVVLLQETSPAWERQIRAAFSDRYPTMAFRHRGGPGGMAVLSRIAVRSVEFIAPTGDGWFPAARVVVEAPFGPMQILNVHLHPPFSDGGSFVVGYFSAPSIRRQEIEAFFGKLDRALPTLVVGDFNEEPDGRVTKFLVERGMTSALLAFAPDQPTWRWSTLVGTFRRQLDHIVYDRRLEPLSAQVIPAGRSDHLPVLAIFRLRPGAGSPPGHP